MKQIEEFKYRFKISLNLYALINIILLENTMINEIPVGFKNLINLKMILPKKLNQTNELWKSLSSTNLQ